MQFYQTCLGGELDLQSIDQSPMAKQWPQQQRQQILHASLKTANFTILASDVGGELVSRGGAMSIALECYTDADLQQYFNLLSVNGSVTHPPHTFFNGTIAALCDKYGINWILKR